MGPEITEKHKPFICLASRIVQIVITKIDSIQYS